MKELLKLIVGAVLLILFLYCAIASSVWKFRNPKANDTTFFTEFISVMSFKKMKEYQK